MRSGLAASPSSSAIPGGSGRGGRRRGGGGWGGETLSLTQRSGSHASGAASSGRSSWSAPSHLRSPRFRVPLRASPPQPRPLAGSSRGPAGRPRPTDRFEEASRPGRSRRPSGGRPPARGPPVRSQPGPPVEPPAGRRSPPLEGLGEPVRPEPSARNGRPPADPGLPGARPSPALPGTARPGRPSPAPLRSDQRAPPRSGPPPAAGRPPARGGTERPLDGRSPCGSGTPSRPRPPPPCCHDRPPAAGGRPSSDRCDARPAPGAPRPSRFARERGSSSSGREGMEGQILARALLRPPGTCQGASASK